MSRTFFTDRDLGNFFPDILKAAGLRMTGWARSLRQDPEFGSIFNHA